MRQRKREVTEHKQIIDIIKRCDVCRLALNDEKYPYIIPLNFGVETDGDSTCLYFHGALEGKKYELIRKNNCVAFEMDCSHKLITSDKACGYTMEYESVIGNGTIEILDGEQKVQGLSVLMRQYTTDDTFSFDERIVNKTNVMKLSVTQMVGKRLMQ